MRTTAVERRPLVRTIKTAGRNTYDETRLHHVHTKVAGWVDRLYANTTGQLVKAGEPLLTLYSPELVASAQEYLIALRGRDTLTDATLPSARMSDEQLLASARRRLLLFDISPQQIRALEASGAAPTTMTLHAPISGHILTRNVTQGEKIEPGLNLLDIADLSHAWVLVNAQRTDQKSYSAELQHLFRSERVSIVTGAGYLRLDRKDLRELGFIFFVPPQDPDITRTPLRNDIDYTNLYVYAHINYPKRVTLTIGGSADFVTDAEGDLLDRNQFNPKFGVTYNPFPATTLRAAVFRVLRRTLPATSQTIEPTQVAGFNHFFDDLQGTDSWLYGIGLDQRFTDNLFGGAVYYMRDLEVPSEERRFDWEERLSRVYLYWTPHPWFALSSGIPV